MAKGHSQDAKRCLKEKGALKEDERKLNDGKGKCKKYRNKEKRRGECKGQTHLAGLNHSARKPPRKKLLNH